MYERTARITISARMISIMPEDRSSYCVSINPKYAFSWKPLDSSVSAVFALGQCQCRYTFLILAHLLQIQQMLIGDAVSELFPYALIRLGIQLSLEQYSLYCCIALGGVKDDKHYIL